MASWDQAGRAARRQAALERDGERGHRSPSDWLGECRRRGWPVDASVLVRRLEVLDAEIRQRGGQRRARSYVASQLRRLRRTAA